MAVDEPLARGREKVYNLYLFLAIWVRKEWASFRGRWTKGEVECIERKTERTGILLEGIHKAVWPEGMK